jgi:hypothetical protein
MSETTELRNYINEMSGSLISRAAQKASDKGQLVRSEKIIRKGLMLKLNQAKKKWGQLDTMRK